jgi:hypothetical protein
LPSYIVLLGSELLAPFGFRFADFVGHTNKLAQII